MNELTTGERTERDPVPSLRRSIMRLALSILAAPLLLAALATGIAFIVAGSGVATREATLIRTRDAAQAFFLFLPLFTLSFGLAGIAILWWRGMRGRLSWAAGGAAAGMIGAAVLGLAGGAGINPVHIAVAAFFGSLIFLVIRWLAGIRLNAGDPPASVPRAGDGRTPPA